MKPADRHDEADPQKSKTLPSRRDIGEPLFTTTKQISRYTTVSGIQSEISWTEVMWPQVTLKELLVNAHDFLIDFYPSPYDDGHGKYGKDERSITVTVTVDDVLGRDDLKFIRISVANSNIADVQVFKHLDKTFDYDIWGSTKRGQHRGTGGALGDYLKRVLGMAYALWDKYNSNIVTNTEDTNDNNIIQWPEPLILRFNKQEYRVFIKVDKDIGNVHVELEGPYKFSADYTEICATLPIPLRTLDLDHIRSNVSTVDMMREEFSRFRIGKNSHTKFDFTVNMDKRLTNQ